jgi:hypothetical protein
VPSNDEGRERPGWVVSELDPEMQVEVRRAVEEAARTAGPDYGAALKDLRESVARVNPMDLLCTLSFWFLTAAPGENPEYDRPDCIFQHHAELIYAAALRTPVDVLSVDEHIWDGLPQILDAAKRSVELFMLLAAKRVASARSEAETRREDVLYDLRIHGAVVRGASYLREQKEVLERLFSPIDPEIEAAAGFGCAQLAEWWWTVTEIVEARMVRHLERVEAVGKLPLDSSWPAEVRKLFPRLPQEPDEDLMARLSSDEEERRGFAVMAGDLNLIGVFGFTRRELAALYPGEIDDQAMSAVLDAWSLRFGDLADTSLNSVLAANPVQRKPILRLGEGTYAWFLSSTFLHSAVPMLEGLLVDHQDLRRTYFERRATFLEEEVARAFEAKFPDATVIGNLLWDDPRDGRSYETDLLVLLGSHAVVIECKSGRASAQALQGKARDLREKIEELIVEPARQAQRFASLLKDQSGAVLARDAAGEELEIDAAAIRRTTTLSITLEPLQALLPTLLDLSEAGLTADDLDAMTYSLSLFDLWLVLEMLDHPSEVLHYIQRRGELENRHFLSGEENDLLGFYLKSGLNLGEAEFDGREAQVVGLSHEIDGYHYQLEAGMAPEKPRVERTPYWEELLSRIEDRKQDRWTEIGIALCNVSIDGQAGFVEAMQSLQAKFAETGQIDTFLLTEGPAGRRDHFVGVLITAGSSEARWAQLEAGASSAVARQPEIRRVICIGWPPEGMGTPYRAFGVIDIGPS